MNYARRLEKLEQQERDYSVRVVLMEPGESEQDALDRLNAAAGDPNAFRHAHAAGRIQFLSWTDAWI